MQRGTAGFLGGVIAGFIKLVIEQISLAINISTSSMPGTISKILFGQSGTYPFFSWIIYILITGLVGWILSKIISKKYTINFLFSGTITGIVLWSLMNVVFMLSGTITPTWSMGLGTCIVTFFSHIVLGIVITYTISKSQIKVTN